MKKNNLKKIILKAGAGLLSLGILSGSFLYVSPMQVSAADLVHDHKNEAILQNSVEPSSEVEVFDPYVTPEKALGKVVMGTAALKSPVEKTYSGNGITGTYYEPQTYIYFGMDFGDSDENNAPILLRVLDAEKDNAGNGGAMFVMTEHASRFNTIFSQYRQYDDDTFYGMFVTENVYNKSVPFDLIDYYVLDSYKGSYKTYFENLREELDYIRPVTVTDKLSSMEGLYGFGKDESLGASFHWEVDTVNSAANIFAIDAEEATYINNKRFFLLSAEEMYKYVSTVPYAPGMATVQHGTNDPVTYWLRTGLDFWELDGNESTEDGQYDTNFEMNKRQTGDNVGAIDANGNVIPLDADESAFVRYGFNIETADISFMYEVAPNTYRLSFIEPLYKAAIENADPENGVDDRFTASVVDVRGDLVTVEVGNAIRNRVHTSYGGNNEDLGVSVFIKDKNSGEVKYYDQIEDALYGNFSNETPAAISSHKSKVYFRLPKDFDHDTDEVYVFWEMRPDDVRGTTFVSNMVKLDCLHPDASEADCTHLAKCPDCGEFGSLNEDNHVNVDNSVYYFDAKNDIHWNVCDDCGKQLNIEACSFGEDCRESCVCKNVPEAADKHVYDENGICIYNNDHYEMPELQYNDSIKHLTVRIDNEGQFIRFAKLLNGGSFEESWDFTVFIENDLNFKGIYGFEPIGTEKHPFDGYLAGKKHTISNIEYIDEDGGRYAGLIGYAKNLSVRNLTVKNCTFVASKYAGVLAGKVGNEGDSTNYFEFMEIHNCTVDANGEGGKEGILIGEACDNISVNDVYSIGVMNLDDQRLRFFSDPESFNNISLTKACLLYDECGEYGERDEAAFASGEVAHMMGKGQKIGEEAMPSTDNPSIQNGTRVFKVTDCAGKLLRYTNEYLSLHNLGDYTEHRITKFHEFIWDDTLISCDARVYCDACKQDLLIPATLTIVAGYAPVRVDYVASVIVAGEKHTSDVKRYIGTRIESMIGMTNKVVEFTSHYVYPTDVLDNHRLKVDPPGLREFDAYFLDPKTGERITDIQYNYYGQPEEIASGVCLPGSYDLLVVGRNAYEGQEYIFEDALTITPITINIEVKDIYKYYDGDAGFTPVFTADNDYYSYIFDVVVSDAPSAEVGEYDLEMGIEVWDESYAEGIEVIFSRDTIKGYIYPQITPTVENKDYPTEFTYGDTIPDPTAQNFTVTEGCEIEFSWFKVEHDFFGNPGARIKLDSKPVDAGKYLLRVTATSDDYLTYAYELPITVAPKQLTLKFEGAEIITDEYDREIFVLDMHQKMNVTIEGFVNGDTAESVGAFITYYQDNYPGPEINDLYVFPYQPLGEDYDVWVYGNLENYLVGGCNYEKASDRITVRIKDPEYPTPIYGYDNLEDGEKQEFGVVYSWTHPITFREDEGVVFYVTVMKDGDVFDQFELYGEEYLEERVCLTQKVTDAGEYSITVKAQYVSEDDYMADYNVNISFTVELIAGENELLDSIVELGDYRVRVTTDGEVREIPVTVCREISMVIKPFDYEHSTGYPEFDIRNFIMTAGKVVLLDHEIVDVKYEFFASTGEISVKQITVVDKNGNDVSHLYKMEPYQDTEIHLFDSPCDNTCNIRGCEYVRAASHKGGAATCNTLAICSECGAEYGSLELNRHTSEAIIITPDPDDHMTHRLLYACCGAVKENAGHVQGTAATCTTLAVCADCGWSYGEFDTDNHSSNEMNYVQSTDDPEKHVATHVCCGASFTEDHSGGEATCNAKAVCEKCDGGYGEIDSDNHVNVIYTTVADTPDVHHAKCNDCGVEWQESHSGGKASCKTLAVCDGCKASYGELDPDNHESEETKYVKREENPSMHDHVHSCCNGFISKAYHSGGEANCATAAICEYCNEQYGSKDPAKHASDETAYKQNPFDGTSHIKYHVCCGEEIEIGAHTGTDTANCEHGNICGICGIEYSQKIGHVYDDANDKQCNVCGKLSLIHI